MTNRTILYGYEIKDGMLQIKANEATTVKRVFELYLQGMSYLSSASMLNRDEISYSAKAPEWNKGKVKRLLENARYIGKDGYPPIVTDDPFQQVQDTIAGKYTAPPSNAKAIKVAKAFRPYLRCGECGGKVKLLRVEQDRAEYRCKHCCGQFVISMTEAICQINQQREANLQHRSGTYVPSAEVLRLESSINRSMEQCESAEQVQALIFQAAAARYDCLPGQPKAAVTGSINELCFILEKSISHIRINSDGTPLRVEFISTGNEVIS